MLLRRLCDYPVSPTKTHRRLRHSGRATRGGRMAERLYTDLVFPSRRRLRVVHHNLEIGAAISPDDTELRPDGGRCPAGTPHPSSKNPMPSTVQSTTGRTYTISTPAQRPDDPRTRGCRPDGLRPDPEADAAASIRDHEMVDDHAPGTVRIPQRSAISSRGHIFIPFHYGY